MQEISESPFLYGQEGRIPGSMIRLELRPGFNVRASEDSRQRAKPKTRVMASLQGE